MKYYGNYLGHSGETNVLEVMWETVFSFCLSYI